MAFGRRLRAALSYRNAASQTTTSSSATSSSSALSSIMTTTSSNTTNSDATLASTKTNLTSPAPSLFARTFRPRHIQGSTPWLPEGGEEEEEAEGWQDPPLKYNDPPDMACVQLLAGWGWEEAAEKGRRTESRRSRECEISPETRVQKKGE